MPHFNFFYHAYETYQQNVTGMSKLVKNIVSCFMDGPNYCTRQRRIFYAYRLRSTKEKLLVD